jgi:hypothetical protein
MAHDRRGVLISGGSLVPVQGSGGLGRGRCRWLAFDRCGAHETIVLRDAIGWGPMAVLDTAAAEGHRCLRDNLWRTAPGVCDCAPAFRCVGRIYCPDHWFNPHPGCCECGDSSLFRSRWTVFGLLSGWTRGASGAASG